VAVSKSTASGQGFHGSFDGLSLTDMIQLQGINHFSGCITISSGEAFGLVFFRDGRIIHAEQGAKSGEQAFRDMIAWTSGSFSTEPNITTTRCTIEKDLQHLIISAHQELDERRAGRASALAAEGPTAAVPLPPPPPRAGSSAPPAGAGAQAVARQGIAAVVERVRSVPGVAYAVLSGKDGACVDCASHRAETLAGRGAFLAMLGEGLGKLLGSGPLRSAALQRRGERLLLLVSKSHLLNVLVEGGTEVGAVEDEVRKLLAQAP